MKRHPFAISVKGMSDADLIRRLTCAAELSDIPDLSAVPAENRVNQFWMRAYAQTSLFLFIAGRLNKIPNEIPEIRPFGDDTPLLSELFAVRDASVVFFPICSKDQGERCTMFLFRKRCRDHRAFLSGPPVSEDLSIFITHDFQPLEQAIDGDSWTLAWHLAKRALEYPQYREKLSRCLVTGSCDGIFVRPVRIGTKNNLFRSERALRIIVPEENLPECPSNVIPVKTLRQAWTGITGSGVEKAEIRLPDPVKCLHILVGGAVKPVFSVILLLNPEKVCLWCSEETETQASLIRQVLADSFPCMEIRKMNSGDLQCAYNDFYSVLDASGRENALICNTGGNRLMGTAALLTAQNLDLMVVYRDVDAERNSLTVIRFGRFEQYISDLVPVQPTESRRINWDWLYGRDYSASGKAAVSAEELKKQLFLVFGQ